MSPPPPPPAFDLMSFLALDDSSSIEIVPDQCFTPSCEMRQKSRLASGYYPSPSAERASSPLSSSDSCITLGRQSAQRWNATSTTSTRTRRAAAAGQRKPKALKKKKTTSTAAPLPPLRSKRDRPPVLTQREITQ